MLSSLNILRRWGNKEPQSWHEPLRDAFARNSAHSHFIDLQGAYLITETAHVFFNSGKIARASRKKGIECSWSYWPIRANPPDVTTDYASMAHTLYAPDRLLSPAPIKGEKLYRKNEMSALSNKFFKAHLGNIEKPTVILGGLVSNQCYAHTAAAILRDMDADVIVPYNATDFQSVTEAKEQLEALEEKFGTPFKGRAHYTSTRDVKRFIAELPTANPA